MKSYDLSTLTPVTEADLKAGPVLAVVVRTDGDYPCIRVLDYYKHGFLSPFYSSPSEWMHAYHLPEADRKALLRGPMEVDEPKPLTILEALDRGWGWSKIGSTVHAITMGRDEPLDHGYHYGPTHRGPWHDWCGRNVK